MLTATESIIRDEFKKLLRDDHPDDFDEIPLADLGVDSLDFIEVMMILEDEHEIVIPVTELQSTVTLRDIFNALD